MLYLWMVKWVNWSWMFFILLKVFWFVCWFCLIVFILEFFILKEYFYIFYKKILLFVFVLELIEKSLCLSKCNIVNLEEEILWGFMFLIFGKLCVSISVVRLIIYLKFMIFYLYVFKVVNWVFYELKNDCNS